MGLEFGRELAYFEEKGAASGPGPTLEGKTTKAYKVEIADSQLILFTSGTPEKLWQCKQHGSKRDVYW